MGRAEVSRGLGEQLLATAPGPWAQISPRLTGCSASSCRARFALGGGEDEVLEVEQADHRADVFSLGVIAYRVLTGRPAFTGADAVATLYNAVTAQPARPGDLVDVPLDVERVLALALAKDAARRLASTTMFATVLRDAFRGRLDPRLSADADALLAEQPWGSATELPRRQGARPPAARRPG
jgi:hypothetical protein